VAGYWNPAIFSPEWIGRELEQPGDINIEFSVALPAATPRFSFDRMYLQVGVSRLVVSPESPDAELLDRCAMFANRVVTKLPHTPMMAAGINFQYLEDQPQGALVQLFQLSDANALADKGFKVASTSIAREIQCASGDLLNLTAKFTHEDAVSVHFNFHRESTKWNALSEFLRTGAHRLADIGSTLLGDTYQTSFG